MPLLVSLRSNFVAEGVRYRAHPDGTIVPDHLEDVLPSSAQIIERREAPKPPPQRFRRKVNPKGSKPKPKAAEGDPETLSQIGDSALDPPMKAK